MEVVFYFVVLGILDECLEGRFYCFRATQTSFGRAEGSLWNGIGVRSKISS